MSFLIKKYLWYYHSLFALIMYTTTQIYILLQQISEITEEKKIKTVFDFFSCNI